MKRSVGLILSAIVLGLAAASMLLFAVTTGLGAFFLRTHPPAPAPPPFVAYFFYATVLILLALAAWAIVTVVGLLFLRQWARYSILVIGGGLSAIGGVSFLGTIVTLVAGLPGLSVSPTPGVNPAVMRLVFIAVAAFYAAVTAVGVWWLVYFNQRRVKQIFLHRDSESGELRLPGPLSRRPVAITILACLFLLGTLTCCGCYFLPFPAFFFGFILPGAKGHALYLGIALLSLLTGVGLLRLVPAARYAAMAFLLIGCLNTLMALLPWYQSQFERYMQQVVQAIPQPAGMPASVYHYPAGQLIVYGAFSIALNGFMIWLLDRHRTAFIAPPPAPAVVAV